MALMQDVRRCNDVGGLDGGWARKAPLLTREGVHVRNVGPLHGTWLVALVFSACFSASAIASSQPWHQPGSASDHLTTADVVALSDDGATQTIGARAPQSSASDDQPRDVSGTRVVSWSIEDDMQDEETVWEKAANHGSYVSAVAKESRGQGAGCEVSSVARSDVGKRNSGDGSPTAPLVRSCPEDPASKGEARTAPDKSDKSDREGRAND